MKLGLRDDLCSRFDAFIRMIRAMDSENKTPNALSAVLAY